MKPVFKAREMCDDFGYSFIDELDKYLTDGWVYSGDDAFVMASEESLDSLLGFNINKGVDIDTWFVYVYVGNLKRVLELIPHNHKYVAFHRNDKALKIYEMKKLLNKMGASK
jgi:hypothetical protein